MKQYATKVTGSQYNLNESVAPGFQVYQARVKVKNPDYSTSIDVANLAHALFGWNIIVPPFPV